MNEMVEAAILGGANDDDIENQFITLFLTYFGQIKLKLF
jgi:hypothetical protein